MFDWYRMCRRVVEARGWLLVARGVPGLGSWVLGARVLRSVVNYHYLLGIYFVLIGYLFRFE